MSETQKIFEYLRYDFTPEEFTNHARELARLNQELARFEEHRKQITAQLGSDLKQKQQAVSDQSRLVSNGYEYRNIECEVIFNDPEKGKKTIVRCDSGEELRIAFMTGDEMQIGLPLDEPPAAMSSPQGQ